MINFMYKWRKESINHFLILECFLISFESLMQPSGHRISNVYQSDSQTGMRWYSYLKIWLMSVWYITSLRQYFILCQNMMFQWCRNIKIDINHIFKYEYRRIPVWLSDWYTFDMLCPLGLLLCLVICKTIINLQNKISPDKLARKLTVFRGQ